MENTEIILILLLKTMVNMPVERVLSVHTPCWTNQAAQWDVGPVSKP